MKGSAGAEHSLCLASIIIPAHNEVATIGRLLGAITAEMPVGSLEIIVVCNGCTDDTASVAHSFGPSVRVIEVSEPSKRNAQRLGDSSATAFPRLYVDADIEISLVGISALIRAIAEDGYIASAPTRRLPRDGVSHVVGWYYDVWEQLPVVRDGLFGRGVIALSEVGNDRIRALPPMMSDDLVMSEAFAANERIVVADAEVVVRPPKTLSDLIRRRVRAATGNAQADQHGLRSSQASTSIGDLVGLTRSDPRLAVRLPVFIGVTVFARFRAQRAIRSGDFDTWLRDESSRQESRPQ